MKKILVSCLLVLMTFSSITFGQQLDLKETLKKVDILVKSKQYQSGYDLLDKTDPQNEVPTIVIKKINLLLDYHAVTTMLQTFGMRNLNKDETIDGIRGQEGAYTYYYLETDKELTKLIKKYPADWNLCFALGKYYYEVYLKYENSWFKPEKELLALTESNYAKAAQNGVFNANSIYTLGYIQLLNNNFEKAVTYFLRYLKLDKNNANATYNIAYAYSQLGKVDDSLKFAETAINLYDNPESKAETARFIAGIYKNKNDNANAIKYYQLAQTFGPNNITDPEALLELYIKIKDFQSAADTADAIFVTEPTSVDKIQFIFRSYYNNEQKEELVKFFQRMRDKYESQKDVAGNIFFHIGYYNKFQNDLTQAKYYFTEARKYLSDFYKGNYYLIKTIDAELKVIDQMEKQKQEETKQ